MKRTLTVHPLLFALFPFLFFYAHNIQEIHTLTLAQTMWLLLLILAITGLAWFLLNLLFKNSVKAALATTIVITAVLLYGSMVGMIQDVTAVTLRNSLLAPLVVAVLAYVFYRIHKSTRGFQTTTQALNVAASFLTVFNLLTIAHYEISASRLLASLAEDAAPIVQSEAQSDAMPDIYFIILDEYGHTDTLAEHFDYDNEPFIEHLEDLGFYVAHDSRTENEKTVRCIATILNMEQTCEHEHRRVTVQRIEQNPVMCGLESLGYELIYFGHYSELDRYEIPADEYINHYEVPDFSPFSMQLTNFMLHSSVMASLYQDVADEDYVHFHRRAITKTLKDLRETTSIEGPKFVFSHFLVPHVPFVFGPEGESVPIEHTFNYEDKEYYLGQLIYITDQITRVIDSILAESDTEPIIILQSDHGPRWVDGWEKILNAFYLPDGGEEMLHDSISPADTFRVVFNYYFDEQLEPEAAKRLLEQ